MTEITAFLEILRQVLDLGWPAIVLIFIMVLWRRIVAVENELHDRHMKLPETDGPPS